MGPSTIVRRPAPVRATNFPEQSEPPSAQVGDTARACDLRSFCAFVLYLSFSIFVFGRVLFGDFRTSYIGLPSDPTLMMWFLVWWPHAIVNALNPFITRAIWAPLGSNLVWQTSIPLASVSAAPPTVTLGPVATFNALCLLSLPLNAWCAFIICRYISQHYWGSLLSGYIFGFSAFMLGHLTSGHLNLLLVFPVPLAAYCAARRLADDTTDRYFTLTLASLRSSSQTGNSQHGEPYCQPSVWLRSEWAASHCTIFPRYLKMVIQSQLGLK